MRRPAPATLQTLQVPAPIGGLNTVASGASIPDGDCVQLYNMISAENGLRARLGSREWCRVANGKPIRTMLPFVGSAVDGSNDRIWAVTSAGFCSVYNGTPGVGFSTAPAFSMASGNAGYGICHAFTTLAGHFLLYCDEENGYWVYTESTASWAPILQGAGPTDVSGVDPTKFCFVMVWKARVWFVEKNSYRVWYLPAGAIYGTATQLNLDRSAQFRQGGDVVGLWNWTLDGGFGIDDNLVVISRGGDVAIYQGTDPSSASTFGLKGTWSAGALPAGRRVATNFGGDVLILTKSGIRPLSQLVSGADGTGTYATAKISNLFNALTLSRSELPGWAMHLHPEDNSLIVLVPTTTGGNTEQLAQSLWNRSWSRYRDLPMLSACVWRKKLYFGDNTGTVWINDGYTDGGPTVTGRPVQWQALTPFRNGNAKQKQVQLIRATILSDTANATYVAEARYGFDLHEIATVTQAAASGPSTFDSGLWDTATWQSDYVATQPTRGATGVGADVAISIRGTSVSRTALVGLDVMYREGGLL